MFVTLDSVILYNPYYSFCVPYFYYALEPPIPKIRPLCRYQVFGCLSLHLLPSVALFVKTNNMLQISPIILNNKGEF